MTGPCRGGWDENPYHFGKIAEVATCMPAITTGNPVWINPGETTK
jgi:hypothetical protein